MSKFVIKPKSIFSKKEYEIFDEAGKSLYYIKYKWKWKYIAYDSDVHDEVIYVHERRDLVNGYITSVYIRHKLLGEIERLEKKLSNEGFVAKAPAAVVEAEKEKLAKYREKLDGVKAALAKLK